MRYRVGLTLLAVIACFVIAIAHYERQSEPLTVAPMVPRAADSGEADDVPAPAGFAHANWTVDPTDDPHDARTRPNDKRSARRKEPTWAGSDIILPDR